jgi:hypothetical protein
VSVISKHSTVACIVVSFTQRSATESTQGTEHCRTAAESTEHCRTEQHITHRENVYIEDHNTQNTKKTQNTDREEEAEHQEEEEHQREEEEQHTWITY